MVFKDGVSSHEKLSQKARGLSGKGDNVRADIQDDIACAPTSLVGTVPSEHGRSWHVIARVSHWTINCQLTAVRYHLHPDDVQRLEDRSIS